MTGIAENLIPFNIMKQQVEDSLNRAYNSGMKDINLTIEYQKGCTRVKTDIPPLTDIMLFDSLALLKEHIENLRIVSFEKGHYSFQSLNKNVYNTENISDNLKIDFFSIINSYVEISKKGNLTQEEINSVTGIILTANSSKLFDPVARLKELGASVITSENAPSWGLYSRIRRYQAEN